LCACLLYLLASPLSTPALGAHLLDAAPPTDVAAEAISPTEVRLTWTDAVGEDTYTILRSTDGGDSWNFYGPYPPDTTSWTDTGVSPCTHYWYRVAALHSGQSLSSGPVAVTTPSSASGGAEPILEESFESLNTPPVPMPEGWQNPGGWVGHTYMGAHDGTYKAMVPSAGGGVLRSPPMNCAGLKSTLDDIGRDCKACHTDFRG